MKNQVLFTLFLCSVLLPFSLNAQQGTKDNPPPFVIPALREWHGDTGTFILKNNASLVVDPKFSRKLTTIANTFLSDLKVLTGNNKITVRKGRPKNGDIFLTLNANDSTLGEEGYLLLVNKSITIKANQATGAFWATRSLLQILEQDKFHRTVPRGTAKDFPQYKVRSFVLDCGRKFFSIEFLRNYVKFMSYYKMNDFQIHLNDNGFKEFFNDNWDSTYSAFRLENDTYPNLTAKDGSYSKKEFIELQKLASQYGVNIVPEIDVPAHSLALTKIIPDIGSNKYGRDHLDLNNPATYEIVDNLFKEYLQGPNPVFRGEVIDIGTDEYDKKESEKFRAFTDHYIRLVQSFGKKVRLWGSLTHAKGTTPVKVDNVTMNLWSKDYSDPTEMMKLGYKCISTPDRWLYIVPAAGYYADYLDTKNIYNNWTPAVNVDDQVFKEDNPLIIGGAFCVWNDQVGNGITMKDVHHRVFPAMQILSQKMWGGSTLKMTYQKFVQYAKSIGEGPGLNMLGRISSDDSLVLNYNKTLQFKNGKTRIQTPLTGIGYGYTVSFLIHPDQNNPDNSVLFSSPDAVVKLKQQATGKLGFSRENYDYTFNYTVPENQWTHIVITGDNKGTSLYVNGLLIERLEGNRNVFPNGKSIAKVQTLFFPLQFIGDKENAFNGLLKSLKVFNVILPADKITELASDSSKKNI